MSSAEMTQKQTPNEQIGRFLEELDRSKEHYAQTSVRQRIALAERCAEGVAEIAPQWVDAACQAKSIPDGSPQRAEEVFAGPVATLRFLRLLVHSLRGIETAGIPRLPDGVHEGQDGRPVRPPRAVPVQGNRLDARRCLP